MKSMDKLPPRSRLLSRELLRLVTSEDAPDIDMCGVGAKELPEEHIVVGIEVPEEVAHEALVEDMVWAGKDMTRRWWCLRMAVAMELAGDGNAPNRGRGGWQRRQ